MKTMLKIDMSDENIADLHWLPFHLHYRSEKQNSSIFLNSYGI